MSVLEWIYNFFSSFFDFLVDVFVWLLESLFYLLSEPLYLLFDGFLLVIEGIFTLLDLSGLAIDTALDWSSLPDQLVWLIAEIDLSQGISIIMSGVLIRVGLNLIPSVFTRV